MPKTKVPSADSAHDPKGTGNAERGPMLSAEATILERALSVARDSCKSFLHFGGSASWKLTATHGNLQLVCVS